MVAMSDEKSGSNEAEGAGVDPVDFGALESDVLSEMELKLVKSKSGWTAILLPMKEMPGDQVEKTLGVIFSGGPVPFDTIRKSLELLKLAVLESSETDGGAKLDDLAFGEWMELLEQWAQT